MNALGWNPTQHRPWQFVCDFQGYWLRTITPAVLALSMPLGQALEAQAAQPAIPTYYAQADFRLPFDVGPASRRPQQLDLLVSRDGGVSWRLHQSVSPTAKAFEVKGAAEGEYLLTVQARDGVSALISQQTTRLVVDRTQPVLAMDCTWDGQEQITVRCVSQDRSLDASTISLRFRCDTAAEYTQIPLDLVTGHEAELVGVGQLQVPKCKRFELLLSARDRAGNEGQTSLRFDAPSSGQTSGQTSGQANPQPDQVTPKPSEVAVAGENSIAASPISQNHLVSQSSLVGQNHLVSQSSLVGHRRVVGNTIENLQELNEGQVPESVPPLNLAAAATPQANQQSTTHAALAGQGLAKRDVTEATRERMVINARQFSLAYEVTSRQTAVHSVELWGTVDGGVSWEFWGYDEDRVSPCKIEVPATGDYGFCVIVVHDSDDLKLRPVAGDRPDLTVQVHEARRAQLSVVR